MPEAVLVTGAFGLVGSSTVQRLLDDGRRVVATDLDVPANRKAAAKLPAGTEVRWADLTDPDAVQSLVSDVSPGCVESRDEPRCAAMISGIHTRTAPPIIGPG